MLDPFCGRSTTIDTAQKLDRLRIVSTMLTAFNQYRVVLEVQPQFQLSPRALNELCVSPATGEQVPLRSLIVAEPP